MSDYFAPTAAIRRINAEPAIALGAGRALLCQVAHPAVARGVADHSTFRVDPFARLQATAEAMYAVVFGSAELAHAVGARVRRVHEYITGPGYRADDVENLLWVHATLCDSAVDAYTRFVGTIESDALEEYYDDMKRVGELFGIPRAALPEAWSDFRAYFDHVTETIEVTDVARAVARDVVHPPLPFAVGIALAPLAGVHRFLAVGTTPMRLREELGFTWGRPEQYTLDAVARLVRAGAVVTPRTLRVLPGAAAGRALLRQAAMNSSAT